MPTPPLSDEKARAAVDAYLAAGRVMAHAARAIGIPQQTFSHQIRIARARGLIPEPDRAPVPAAVREHMARAGGDPDAVRHAWIVSPTDDGGRVSAFWKPTVRTFEEMCDTAASAIREALAGPAAPPTPPPEWVDLDYLALLGLPDWHLLMQAWGKETGEDYDIRIAERDFKAGVAALIGRARPAGTCVLLGLGDQFHANADDARVGRGKHLGQVDGRLLKAFHVAVWCFIWAVRVALTKFGEVKVRILPGNHDEHLAGMLAVAVAVAFEGESRVSVDLDPSYWWHLQFGRNLFVATHGDNMKSRKQIAGVAAHKFRRAFGETDHHFLMTGDKHHEKIADEPGWLCIQLRAMTAADAYSAMSFLTPREVSMWVFHRERGRTDVLHELLPIEGA